MASSWTSSDSLGEQDLRLLLLDNYDSYTWILAHLLEAIAGVELLVRRNDALSREELVALAPDAVVISPGPGDPKNPADFGICAAVFEVFPELPVLGVCLGHQGLALACGGRVDLAPEPVHGRADLIFHDSTGIFEGIPNPTPATRYHSLVVTELPEVLVANAHSADGLVMGLRHRERPWWGVQFHPESIATPEGRRMLQNFVVFARNKAGKPQVPAAFRSAQEYAPKIQDQAQPRADAPPRPLPWQEPTAYLGAMAAYFAWIWLDDPAGFSVLAPGAKVLRNLDPAALRAVLAPHRGPLPYGPGFYGYIGYSWGRHLGLPLRQVPKVGELPELALLQVEEGLVFDHSRRQLYQFGGGPEILPQALPASRRPTPPQKLKRNREKVGYLSEIKAIQTALRMGESYEGCLSLEASSPCPDPLAYHLWLRSHSPARYGCYLQLPEGALSSCSPELFLELRDGTLRTEPIKGTRGRGSDPAADQMLADELLSSEKDRAELLMITDLLRNDLARVAERDTVQVPTMRALNRHPTVMHTSSVIEARLKEGLDLADVLAATFPGGSVTGAPKHRTVAILEGLEQRCRGVYTGAIGYFAKDQAHLSVAIRTAEIVEGRLRAGAGGAIVVHSDPESEWEEVGWKLAVMVGEAEEAGGQ
jgi:para-aminobenzoate synthetase